MIESGIPFEVFIHLKYILFVLLLLQLCELLLLVLFRYDLIERCLCARVQQAAEFARRDVSIQFKFIDVVH